MNRLLFLSAVAVAAVAPAFAEPPAGGKKPVITEEKRAAGRERILMMQGGPRVEKPGSRKGIVAIVNAQTRADAAWIDAGVAYLFRETRLDIKVQKGAFDLTNPARVGELTLYVVDDAKLPRLLVAPENGWAMMNVAPLFTDKPAFFEARVKKQLSRAYAMLCGGMSSNYAASLAGAVPSTEALDAFKDNQLPVDVLSRIPHFVESFGIKPAVIRPYKIACREGWAPSPTNKVMQTIWDQVHALPSDPIKIKYDPKRDK